MLQTLFQKVQKLSNSCLVRLTVIKLRLYEQIANNHSTILQTMYACECMSVSVFCVLIYEYMPI